MTAITEMLNRLAEIAPDVCQKKSYSDGPTFVIGSYSFWYDSLGNFQAYTSVVATGRAALAWLADAIMGECEKRGWDYELSHLKSDGYLASIPKNYWGNKEDVYQAGWHDGPFNSIAEALLAAFLAAMEVER